MQNEQNGSFRTIWLGLLLGALIATSPTWLANQPHSNYDAPWIYPGLASH
ncbi:MAG TPA: hypothetical protein V6C72_19235 [Chroococcales cyanobacterium]